MYNINKQNYVHKDFNTGNEEIPIGGQIWLI